MRSWRFWRWLQWKCDGHDNDASVMESDSNGESEQILLESDSNDKTEQILLESDRNFAVACQG